MTFDDETLMAYADGELDETRARAVEAALRDQPELVVRVETMRATRARVAAAFAPIAVEPAPERLQALLRSPGDVVSLDAVRAARANARAKPWRGREWSALAAGIAAVLVIGLYVSPPRPGASIVADARGVRAGGALAHALTTRLAGEDGAVRLGISFRAKDGPVCRTFGLARPNVSGLACRENNAWEVRALAEVAPQAVGAYRQAGSAEAPEILAAVERTIQGEAFDAAAEKQALRDHWK
jgi:hypothetical protein